MATSRYIRNPGVSGVLFHWPVGKCFKSGAWSFIVFLIIALSAPSHAKAQQDQIALPLTGQSLKTGQTVFVNTSAPIPHSGIYSYSVTGTVVGTGTLAYLTGTGVDLARAFSLSEAKLVPFLSGTDISFSEKWPVSFVNKLVKGSYTLPPSVLLSAPPFGTSIQTSVRLKVGIDKNGVAFGEFTNLRFALKIPHVGTILDKDDSITFENGGFTIEPVALTTGTQPDLSLWLPSGLVGVGITGTDGAGETCFGGVGKGQTIEVPVIIQNAGLVADTYKLTGGSLSTGFTQKFIYKTKNITAQVSGTSGFTFPPQSKNKTTTLAPGEIAVVEWQIADKAKLSGSTTGLLTITSQSSGAQDAVGFSVSAQ